MTAPHDRYAQCDATCTTDCGACKGRGRPVPVVHPDYSNSAPRGTSAGDRCVCGGVRYWHAKAPYGCDDCPCTEFVLAPKRIQLRRTKGWRKPEGAVVVSRPSKWGNPFIFGDYTGLARVPAVFDPSADWEYEGRISADGTRHDFFHPDGRVTICHVRYMTRAEVVETYRRLLTGDLTPAMRSAGLRSGPNRTMPVTLDDVRRELAGHDLACWCKISDPCHADVLLAIARGDS